MRENYLLINFLIKFYLLQLNVIRWGSGLFRAIDELNTRFDSGQIEGASVHFVTVTFIVAVLTEEGPCSVDDYFLLCKNQHV